MKWICIAVLKAYKATLSKLLGKKCIYSPTCSVYAMEAYREYGFFLGTYYTAERLLRCAPWSKKRGFDPLPLNPKGEIKWSL